MPKIADFRRALVLGLCPVALVAPMVAHGAGAPMAASVGLNTSGMDRSIRPGDDFYLFANGTWARETAIPADRASVGGFYIADQSTEKRITALVAEVVAGHPVPGSDAALIHDYYRAYLDTGAINALGMAPAQADLAAFAAIANKAELSRMLGAQVRADVDPLNATDFQTENLFGLFITQSLNGTAVMPYVLQGGLGLPEREYYLSADPKMADIRAKYRAYIATILNDAGLAATPAEADARAQKIYDLEIKIAQAHESREQSEDFQHANAEWTRADFAAKAPGIDWDAFFTAAGLGQQDRFAAFHDQSIPRIAALVASEPLDVWKDWLAFHQVNQYASVLPTKIDDDRFAFYGEALQGVKVQRSRERRAIAALNGALGDALGRLYVAKYFPASDKARIQGMVSGIKQAFATRIAKLDWMAPATKQEAIAKVRGIVVGVGYPDKWKDYSALKLSPDKAYANAKAAGLNEYHLQLAKIGKPLDRGEWWMNAQLVNAVNLPVQNALNFPAAILQKPFYDPAADAAFNYGAIGAVIGHEISHSFDNNGAAFDASGRLRDWWTSADMARFKQAGKALADQFSAYEPFPGLHVQGELTLGENIADVAGLAAALDAYHASLKGKPAPVVNGMTGDQRFFLAFAQSWATKAREAAMRAQIATDGHAPGQYRALTVRNVDDWYKAFNVKPGDKLYLPPAKRVKVW
ncbi:M13 family metallopeptidase [Novosphingobium sp. KACC 22771]|uniref:M13 family metallopeptidase n=1 Tax=Novosphingobium sp. KACC 22771 TaxID=3025670 RepID=UPI002366FF62|nr:M13 family metallopeptidase [Novosphingobium sp. KACC 22771]WDF71640.1 M13 family metallopeptidase [Novosphingobium sp. KACC 22771]